MRRRVLLRHGSGQDRLLWDSRLIVNPRLRDIRGKYKTGSADETLIRRSNIAIHGNATEN